MTDKPSTKILIQARKMLAKPFSWTKGTFSEQESRAPTGFAYCSLGGLHEAQSSLGISGVNVALAALTKAAREAGFEGLVGFNDDPKTTKKDVLALFDRAIEANRS